MSHNTIFNTIIIGTLLKAEVYGNCVMSHIYDICSDFHHIRDVVLF